MLICIYESSSVVQSLHRESMLSLDKKQCDFQDFQYRFSSRV